MSTFFAVAEVLKVEAVAATTRATARIRTTFFTGFSNVKGL